MFRVVCNNMAQGVREVTIKRGYDPREFPFIAAGGAGPIHSCQICNELEIPLQIVPRESSVLCAMGMLLSDLQHDFVRTFVASLAALDWTRLDALVDDMIGEGERQLVDERIPASDRRYTVTLDCRYAKQYHEVGVAVPREAIARARRGGHRAGPAPRAQPPLRLFARARKRRDRDHQRPRAGRRRDGQAAASRGGLVDGGSRHGTERPARRVRSGGQCVSQRAGLRRPPVACGQRIAGPAIIEEVTTAVVLTGTWDAIVDKFGSFVLYRKGRDDLIAGVLAARPQEVLV